MIEENYDKEERIAIKIYDAGMTEEEAIRQTADDALRMNDELHHYETPWETKHTPDECNMYPWHGDDK